MNKLIRKLRSWLRFRRWHATRCRFGHDSKIMVCVWNKNFNDTGGVAWDGAYANFCRHCGLFEAEWHWGPLHRYRDGERWIHYKDGSEWDDMDDRSQWWDVDAFRDRACCRDWKMGEVYDY